MKKLLSCAVLAFLLSPVSQAASFVNATGEGYCNSYSQCGNTNKSVIGSDYSGQIYANYKNWFAFNIPTAGIIGPITSAVINIYNYNNGLDNSSPTETFNLYQAGSISYGGLANGPVLGSILASAADTGTPHYVSILLNAAGIAALTAAEGGQFTFGGSDSTTTYAHGVFSDPSSSQAYPTGIPGLPVAYLALNTPIPPILLPAALSILGLGYSGILGFKQKK